MTLVRLNTLVGSELVFQKHLIFDYRFFFKQLEGPKPLQKFIKKIEQETCTNTESPKQEGSRNKEGKKKMKQKRINTEVYSNEAIHESNCRERLDLTRSPSSFSSLKKIPLQL